MKKLAKAEAYVGAAILGVQLVAMLAEVIGRYFFGKSIIWSEELVRYLFIWFIYLGAAYCVTTEQHITVDILAQYLPKKAAHVMEGITNVLWIGLSGWATYLSADYTAVMYQRGTLSTALHVPMWIIYLALPVGFGLMTVRLIVRLYTKFLHVKKAESAEEVKE